MGSPTLGYLQKADSTKLGSIPIKDGNIVYDEYSASQRVDHNGSMHIYGSVLSGSYNGNAYTNFESSMASNIAISDLVNVKDGQLIKSSDGIFQVRKINGYTFLTKINETENYITADNVAYIINIPSLGNKTANIDILLSISNNTHGEKIFLLKIVNNALDLTQCKDSELSTFDQSLLDLTVLNKGTLFILKPTITSKVKIISYSVTVDNSSSYFSEGLYVVASDDIV